MPRRSSSITKRRTRRGELASLEELFAITGPKLAYELVIYGLCQFLEGPRGDEPMDTEGKRNAAQFEIELRTWLDREARKRGRPAAILAMLSILEKRRREDEERS